MIYCSIAVSKSEQQPKDGQIGLKNVVIDVILMLF
jgi:hypothetical protein